MSEQAEPHPELIDALDGVIDMVVSIKRSVRQRNIPDRIAAEAFQEIKNFKETMSGMVVDFDPIKKSGVACPHCGKPIKITLS